MKRYKTVVLILLIITAGIFILRTILAFNGYFLEQVSGSWAALAVDLANGLFYRPLFLDVSGSGGTRWMPLYFVIHALLIKATGDVIFSGLMLSLLSSFMLVSALIFLLKYYRFTPVSAVVIITLLLSSSNLLIAMTSVRGDILAAALNIWGIYFAVTSGKRPRRIVFSCLLFSLTIMTKVTSCFGIAAVILWLCFNNNRRRALKAAGLFILFTSCFLALIIIFSPGRFIDVFTFCASGGTTIIKFLKSPFNFVNCVSSTDPGVIIILTAGLTVMFNKGRDIVRTPYALYMAVTLAVTLFIFGSEGIVGNHLIDIHTASVLALAGFAREHEISDAMIVRCTAVVIILALAINSYTLRQVCKRKPLLASMEETSAVIGGSAAMLSQNPWLPIIMKREVYILDPYMFRIIDHRNPWLLSSFYGTLDRGGFDCIVFDQDPLSPWIPGWFDYSHFGRVFLDHVFRHYRFSEEHDGFYIYKPLRESPDIHGGR